MKLSRDRIIQRFLLAKRGQLLSPKTLSAYGWALEYLPDELFKHHDQIPAIYAEYARCEGRCIHPDKSRDGECPGRLGLESVRDLDRMFRTFYTWVEAEGLGRNVMGRVARPKREIRYPRVFTDTEIEAICHACATLRDQALIALALGAGLRIGEMWQVKWADFQQPDQLRVWGKGKKHRDVYLDLTSPLPFKVRTPLGALLNRLRAEANGGATLWPTAEGSLTYDGAMQVFRRVVDRAGIEGPRIGPHTFRHTFATLYLRAGGSLWALQRQLGHEDIETTMLYPRMVGRDVQDDVRKTRMFTVIRPDGSEKVVEVAG